MSLESIQSFAPERYSAKFLTAGWIKKANAKGIDGQAAYDFYVGRVKELSKL